jgi:hypothetical protein
MSGDRYLKAILTIIALELGWIAVSGSAPPVSAQQTPTPVVIAGIDLGNRAEFLPVAILGQPRNAAEAARFQPLEVNVGNDRPISVSASGITEVRVSSALRIDTSRPLRVENVGYTPGRTPGD